MSLVSCLIPSRKNPVGLLRTVRSIRDSTDPSNVDILIWLDEDDEVNARIVPDLKEQYHCQIVTGPRGAGYLDIGRFITTLAHHASSPWIMQLDDDITLDKLHPSAVNWDEQLKTVPTWGVYVEPEFYHLNNSHYPTGSCSPVAWCAPNRFWERFDYKALTSPADACAHDILIHQQKWGKHLLRGIICNHQREETRVRE